MESLPNDVVLVVLHKLAIQDPRSLLRATCACKMFHREAENNRVIWKDAFFGRDSSSGDHCKDESIEAEILAVGGYEQLVKAWWALPGRSSTEQKQGAGSVAGSAVRDSSAGEYKLNKLLFVLREKGRLLLWGLFVQERPSSVRELGDFRFKDACRAEGPDRTTMRVSTSRLEPVFADLESVVYSRMKTKVAKSGRVIERSNLVLEIFKFPDEPSLVVGHNSKDSQFWVCELDYEGGDNVWGFAFVGNFRIVG